MPKPSEKTLRLQADKEVIQQMLDQGASFRQIGLKYGCSYTLVQYVMKPEMKKDRQRKTNDRKNRDTTGVKPRSYGKPEPKVIVAGELEPPDTRDLTGRMFGDPLPGRSYLDRMRAKQGA
jgi:hypothetical protein